MSTEAVADPYHELRRKSHELGLGNNPIGQTFSFQLTNPRECGEIIVGTVISLQMPESGELRIYLSAPKLAGIALEYLHYQDGWNARLVDDTSNPGTLRPF